MKIPVMIQMQPAENGATALCMILGYYKRFVTIEEMRKICTTSRNGSSPGQIAAAAQHYGLEASVETCTAHDLEVMSFPVIIQWKKRYYALIKSIRGDIVTVVDPSSGEYKIKLNKLEQLFTGTVITFKKGSSFKTGGRRESMISLIRGRMHSMTRVALIMLIFTAICFGLNLAMVHQNKKILDGHMGKPNSLTLDGGYSLLLLYTALMIVYVVCSITRTRIVNRAIRMISARSGITLFKKILRQPLRFFEQYSTWDMMSRLETNVTLDNSILKTFAPRLIDAIMSVVYLVYLFSYSRIIAAACVSVVIVSILINGWIQEKTAIAAKSMTTYGSIVNASLLNGMNMIDTIKSTGTERIFYRMWKSSQIRFMNARRSQLLLSSLSTGVSILSGNILQALQLFIGAYLVTHGSFTLGTMSLFQGVLGSMVTSLNNCVSATTQLQIMRTGIERINDINHRESLPTIPLKEGDQAEKMMGQLSARDICFRYNGEDHLALDHVSIDAAPGQMIAIVGSTGCGKSTLLKILADLYTAESGEVLYDGKRRSDIPDVVFHSSVCTVDQEAVMFEDSIYNNLRMWDSTIENYEVIMAAKDAQIHKRISMEKQDYSAMIEENGRNFSGGELQRLELARALAHEPTLLLLDEFTSALDAITEDNAIKALRNKGTTCVIVAHRLSTIVDCDCIYVMDNGRIVQQGTHQELYQQEGLYRELIG